MTFGPCHYVPVLKIKRGEKHALRMLKPPVVAFVTPVLEVVENRSDKTATEHLDTTFKDLAPAIQRVGRYFLDTREIAPAGSAAATDAFSRARKIGRPFTPVTGITRTVDTAAAIAAGTDGIALRLTRQEFEDGIVPTALPRFVAAHRLVHERTDLLVDLGPLDSMVAAGISRLSELFLRAVPAPGRWRTLTLLGSAFPLSMKVVERHSHAFAERGEWLSWRDSLFRRRTGLARLPTFGDCVIQHPSGVEGFDPRMMQVSATLRYALSEQWLLVKGESTSITRSKVQFPKLASKLTKGTLSSHFAGIGHCVGCYLMVQAARGAAGLGSPEVWRRLGTAHHITVASEQIRALTWP